ncbi:MAG: hypothetical protein IJ571_03215 [Ruminococcus sp.]|nr:hypothetical protein [Clostridia bacterium]MBR1422442.1 hypothetical protein [Ruminococcus sp.]
MPEVLKNRIAHFERQEEIDILNYIKEQRCSFNIGLYGQSGCGKTYLLNRIVSSEMFDKNTIIWCDFKRLPNEIDNDLFYNYLIYKVLQSRGTNQRTTDFIAKDKTFLRFLEDSKYVVSVKNNIKKTIISSLALIPTIGVTLSQIFDIECIDKVNCEYQNNTTIFYDYLKWHSNKGDILFIFDNIQTLPIDIIDSFRSAVSEFSKNVSIISAYTLNKNEEIRKGLLSKYSFYFNNKAYRITNITKKEFKKICDLTLTDELRMKILSDIDTYYSLVSNGNFREIDEMFFQLNCNPDIEFEYSPIINGLLSLDEIKKDIIDLTAIFDDGISIDFVKQIILYNHSCTENEVIRSINDLKISKYVIIENNILFNQHDKIIKAAKKTKEIPLEENRLINLISSCNKLFMDKVYNELPDAEFVFCINALMELHLKFDFIKHIGLFEKYIDIIYSDYNYLLVCRFYCKLVEMCPNPDQIIVFLPLKTIIQILDSCQKTSNFEIGLTSCKTLQDYYNVNSFKAKYLLQTYHYDEAINTINDNLNSYENWSILINALQHKRLDEECVKHIKTITQRFSVGQYIDLDYYYIILRNTGHLFDFLTAKKNIEEAEKYFCSINNNFATLTCLNNLGIVYLYESKGTDNKLLDIAQKHLTKSFEGMHEIRSNEIYQSAMNLGITYMYLRDYFSAQRYFSIAKKEMPSNLTFDILKFECNCIILKYLSNEFSVEECISALDINYHKALNFPDPWLKLLYKYNICALNECGANLNDYPGDYKKYGLFISNNYANKNTILMLGPSPHWRY